MTATGVGVGAASSHRPAQFRYGVVFLVILGLLVFEVVAPDADWARAVAVALAGLYLVTVIGVLVGKFARGRR